MLWSLYLCSLYQAFCTVGLTSCLTVLLLPIIRALTGNPTCYNDMFTSDNVVIGNTSSTGWGVKHLGEHTHWSTDLQNLKEVQLHITLDLIQSWR